MVTGNVRYQITRVIGEGAFGAVYEANRMGEGLSRRVAMKLLHATHAGKVGIEQRLRDEARMLSLIHHRAIVRVDDLIQLDGAWCVVMEYVDGLDIAGLLDVGPLPPRAALQVAEEVANALHAAYAQAGPDGQPLRLVHRDIKPANIRITPQGEVKLLDFGIARAEFQTREAATVNTGFGTIIYMAPERFRGEDTAGGDVYALGVTLFEMLTAQAPGQSAGDADRHPPGRRLREQWFWIEELSPDLLKLVLEMLEDEPGDRPSARDCARRLGRLLQTLPGDALEDWSPDHVPAAATGPQQAPRNERKPPSQGTGVRVGMTVGGGTMAPSASRASATMGFTTEPDDGQLTPAARPTRRTRKRAGWPLMVLIGLLAAALFLFVVTGAVGVWAHYATGDTVAPSLPEPTAQAMPATPLPGAQPASVGRPSGTATSPGASPSSSGKPPTASRSTSTASSPPAPSGDSPARSPTVASPVSQPAPAPVAEPAPEPATAPSTPAAATTGAIVFSGDALEFSIPGVPSARAAPPGTYSASVTFPSGVVTVSGITVEAGRTTRVKCAAQFASCRVLPPE